MTPDQIRNILKTTANLNRRDLEEEFSNLLVIIADGFEQDIRDATDLLGKVPMAFKVGALRARIEAREKRVKVLQSLGFIHQGQNEHRELSLTHEQALRILRGEDSVADGMGSGSDPRTDRT